MWYEILPSVAIITAALSVPHFASFVINHLAIGKGFRRQLQYHSQHVHYIRDVRLTGHPYKIQGLDAIPDK